MRGDVFLERAPTRGDDIDRVRLDRRYREPRDSHPGGGDQSNATFTLLSTRRTHFDLTRCASPDATSAPASNVQATVPASPKVVRAVRSSASNAVRRTYGPFRCTTRARQVPWLQPSAGAGHANTREA